MLHGEGLVSLTMDGHMRITHAGVREVEDAFTKPQLTTAHFPAYVLDVQNMTNSSIQQGTNQSSVAITVTSGDVEFVRQLIACLQASIDQLQLSAQATAEMKSEIQTLASRVCSPKPKKVIITETLRSIRTILEGAAGNLIAAGLAAEIVRRIG